VVTDLHGVTGRDIMGHLIAGERDPKALAQLARTRARRKISQLEEALEGAEFFTPEHAALLTIMLQRVGYRRLARKRGKLKAQVAVGNTQLKVYHKLLSSPGMRYVDLGPDYYERRRDVRRQIAYHVGRLGDLGFEVTLCRIPDPEPAGPGNTQAA
jgi:hypothetical protein